MDSNSTLLWLTDRSRYMEGLSHCAMARYLRYHAGPDGYGFERKAQALPLATGIYVHACLAAILTHIQGAGVLNGRDIEDDALLSGASFRQIIRTIIGKQIDEYKQLVKARGFLDIEGASESAFVMEEQACLIEGLVWAWVKVMLPLLLDEYEILSVESEEVFTANGPEPPIGFMSRPDIVLKRKSDDTVGIHDFKTTSTVSTAWIDEWRQSVQMASGTVAVEARLGVPVPHYYIHALIKGQRKQEYNPATQEYDGPKRQSSFLCYAYYREANPPLVREDIQPQFKYRDEEGRNRTLGKNYSKVPVWQLGFRDKPAGYSNIEWWVEKIPVATIWGLFALIGPYERQDFLIKTYLRELGAEERRWIDKLWRLYKIAQDHEWSSDEFQEALSQEIPRSWACVTYGSNCPYVPICFRHTGWKDPLASGLYIARRPHHIPELDQMKERGITVPPREIGDEDV